MTQFTYDNFGLNETLNKNGIMICSTFVDLVEKKRGLFTLPV